MKIKNRLLGSLSLIAVMSVVSLASVSAATASSAGSKKSSGDGMQVGIFYSPSMINGKIDVSDPTGLGANAHLKSTIDFKDHTKFAWLGGGARVGYKMGDVIISAVTDYRMTDYYKNDGNVDIAYPATSESENVAGASDTDFYNMSFEDVTKWYTGIDVDYVIGISKEMSASIGAGAGMEYNSMNVKYTTDTAPSVESNTTESERDQSAKLTALPFAVQGNLGFGYEVTPGITPYVGYTLRYAFEKDLEPKEDDVNLAQVSSGTGAKVKLPMKLQSSVDHIFKIGVNFTF